MNPIVFSFLREGLSAPILLAAAVIVERPSPDPRDSGWFFALGIVGIFGTQLFYILGISISGAIVGSIMQPSIPVWTTLICMIFRLEPPSVLKVR
jgi:drug/metabolite transporter (DMT)-like permease